MSEKPKAEEREKEIEMQEMTADSLEKSLMLGKIEGKRRKGWQRVRWLDGITDSMHMNLSNSRRQWRTGEPGML